MNYVCIVDANGLYRSYGILVPGTNDQIVNYVLADGEYAIASPIPRLRINAGDVGFVVPKWNGECWVEYATDSEIREWEATHPKPDEPTVEPEVPNGPSQDDINKFMMMQAQDAADTVAFVVPTLYNVWEAGKHYGNDGEEKIVRVPSGLALKGDYLYRCIQPHTSQADWRPVDTPALWTRINKSNAGTIEDPISAAASMEYEYGLYYLDPSDGKIYLCERIGEAAGGKITLHYLPHELVGQYFTLAGPSGE